MFKLKNLEEADYIKIVDSDNNTVAEVGMIDNDIIISILHYENDFLPGNSYTYKEFKKLEHQIDMAVSHVRIKKRLNKQKINNLI